eukprot:4092285-Amphidinium_carterae.1
MQQGQQCQQQHENMANATRTTGLSKDEQKKKTTTTFQKCLRRTRLHEEVRHAIVQNQSGD